MSVEQAHVIIGAAQADGCAAAAMRAEGFEGRIVLVGEEGYVPYERPPLSKQVLAGDWQPERTYLKRLEFYQDHGIELRLDTRAISIDGGTRRV